jgi:hypothetical protein
MYGYNSASQLGAHYPNFGGQLAVPAWAPYNVSQLAPPAFVPNAGIIYPASQGYNIAGAPGAVIGPPYMPTNVTHFQAGGFGQIPVGTFVPSTGLHTQLPQCPPQPMPSIGFPVQLPQSIPATDFSIQPPQQLPTYPSTPHVGATTVGADAPTPQVRNDNTTHVGARSAEPTAPRHARNQDGPQQSQVPQANLGGLHQTNQEGSEDGTPIQEDEDDVDYIYPDVVPPPTCAPRRECDQDAWPFQHVTKEAFWNDTSVHLGSKAKSKAK